VEYPLFLAGRADKDAASAAFPAVDRVRAYPTTIFLAGDGRVRAVHSGYAGPATGAEHEALRARFEGLIEECLASPLPERDEERSWLQRTWRVWSDDPARAGALVDLVEHEGELLARTRTADGAPAKTVPVALSIDSVWLGERVYRLEREAGVLTSPFAAGERLAPAGGPCAPLLAQRGFADEAGYARALSAPDPLVRREALVALARAREAAGAGLPEAVALLDDASVEVRATAAWAAGRCHEPAARERLYEPLDHPNAALRREVARALARMAERMPGALLILAGAEDDHDPIVRELVARALGR
jgi:hypothetical protein